MILDKQSKCWSRALFLPNVVYKLDILLSPQIPLLPLWSCSFPSYISVSLSHARSFQGEHRRGTQGHRQETKEPLGGILNEIYSHMER